MRALGWHVGLHNTACQAVVRMCAFTEAGFQIAGPAVHAWCMFDSFVSGWCQGNGFVMPRINATRTLAIRAALLGLLCSAAYSLVMGSMVGFVVPPQLILLEMKVLIIEQL